MPIIKFSYHFPKLIGEDGYPIRAARLIEVLDVEISDLSEEFIQYDTGHGLYRLPPRGAFLMLIFQKPGFVNLFTTIRRSTPEKRDYYRSQVGERFDLQIQPAP
jgi:hypothetical protein